MKELEYPFDNKYILRNRKKIKRKLEEQSELIEKKVAILSGSTVGEIRHIIEIFLLENGIKPIFWEGQYNRFYEESIFEVSYLKEFAPDVIYIHTSVKNIENWPDVLDNDEKVQERIELEFERFTHVWGNLKKEIGCPIIQNNFEYLPYRLFGNSDVYQVSGKLRYLNRLNNKISEYARKNKNFYINDLNYEAAYYGLEKWFDNEAWYLYKYPFSINAIPSVAYNISNIIKSLFGKNKKVLITDLDNTLWGGAIGDLGVEHIKIGIETAEGMAYSELQEYIKNLGKIGVMLAVCSKNEMNIALEGLNKPECFLKKEDFLSLKINWENKNLNIEEIIHELNIMEDSVVFLDDNPAERQIINMCLPNIKTPVFDKAQEYLKNLDGQGYFEVTAFSEDDKKRNDYYKANIKREAAKYTYSDYKMYLKSLEMRAYISDFNTDNMERIVQLINKTNQFNFTTRRYTYDEVVAYKNSNTITFSVKLSDKFGENGIVSCLMASIDSYVASIDLWVMSCRVFKRDLEKAVLDELILRCQKQGVEKIKGLYIKSKKNTFIENLYEELGFSIEEKDSNHGVYVYDILKCTDKYNKVMEVYYE